MRKALHRSNTERKHVVAEHVVHVQSQMREVVHGVHVACRAVEHGVHARTVDDQHRAPALVTQAKHKAHVSQKERRIYGVLVLITFVDVCVMHVCVCVCVCVHVKARACAYVMWAAYQCVELRSQQLGLGLGQAHLIKHHHLSLCKLCAQRYSQRKCAHLPRQI